MIGRVSPIDPPPGWSTSEAVHWNAILDRHPRLEALCDGRDEDTGLRERHEEEAVRLAASVRGEPLRDLASTHRLRAYERLVLAALNERPLTTVGELVARLRPGSLTSDQHRVERAVFSLITRRFIARRRGGGFVLLRRAA